MKILFFDPPVLIGKRPPERVFGCTYGLYPIPNIFLLQVAAVLRGMSQEVKYKNFPLENLNREKFIKFLKKDDSDIYCIYSVYLATKIDLEALRIIRDIKPNKKIIFFGPAPTYKPETYLVDEDAIVVRGEPEITFFELADAIKNKESFSEISGISFMHNGRIFNNIPREININLDALPFSARDLIDASRYFNPKFGKEKFTAILTSRGCPYRCKFCVPCSISFAREIEYKKMHQSKPCYTARSAHSVIEEFRLLKEQGYTAVSILDDEFTIDKKRVTDICKGIKDFKIKWGCLSRADSLNEEVVREMSLAGCVYIDIGVESFNQKILDDIQKNLKIETINSTIELTKKYNIFTKINIMFGSSSFETKHTIRETLKNIKILKPDAVMFGVCNPFPGTQYYNIAKDKGWFIKGDYFPVDVQKESTINLPNISKRELELSVRKANFNFYANPRFMIKNVARIRSLGELFNKVVTLKRKFF